MIMLQHRQPQQLRIEKANSETTSAIDTLSLLAQPIARRTSNFHRAQQCARTCVQCVLSAAAAATATASAATTLPNGDDDAHLNRTVPCTYIIQTRVAYICARHTMENLHMQ